jgi:hypothetical protein
MRQETQPSPELNLLSSPAAVGLSDPSVIPLSFWNLDQELLSCPPRTFAS